MKINDIGGELVLMNRLALVPDTEVAWVETLYHLNSGENDV